MTLASTSTITTIATIDIFMKLGEKKEGEYFVFIFFFFVLFQTMKQIQQQQKFHNFDYRSN